MHYPHKQKIGVLLVNLGSPKEPTAGAVRRYLRQFLSDKRVVELPRWLWWLVLNGIVLVVRPKKSAEAYRKIWMEQHGSPLIYHTQQQAEALHESLNDVLENDVVVDYAMRYGEPSMASAVERLCERGVDKLLVLPMYPQYSATTTASIVDEMGRILSRMRNQPEVRYIKDYFDHEPYIAAMAAHIREHWQTHGQSECLLLSFHGLPQRCINKGDPYREQCEITARLLADELLLEDQQWQLVFQSRFGAEEWLQPYLDKTLERMGGEGVNSVDVFCPGFASDCLETLEEIAIQGQESFSESGGGHLQYIPALNARDRHVEALVELCERHLGGWGAYLPDDRGNPISRLFNRVVGGE
ncbi:ferrochelatase [gamma proteobacterium HTCC5015]|nr:ferrochelatase [gamma proteobacterium HTCC5015]